MGIQTGANVAVSIGSTVTRRQRLPSPGWVTVEPKS